MAKSHGLARLAPRGPKRPRHPPKTPAAPDLIRGLDGQRATAWHGKAPRPGTASAPRPEAPTTPGQTPAAPDLIRGLDGQRATAWHGKAPRPGAASAPRPERPRHPPKTPAAPDLIRGLDDMARNAHRTRPRCRPEGKRPPSTRAPHVEAPGQARGRSISPRLASPARDATPAPDFPRGGDGRPPAENISDRIAGGDEAALEEVRLAALGKKGEVSLVMRSLGRMSPEERKEAGRGSTPCATRSTAR